MPKSNTHGGKKHKRGKKKTHNDDVAPGKEPRAGANQLYAVFQRKLGGKRVLVECTDGKTRQGLIPGSMYKKQWLNAGNVVLCTLDVLGKGDTCQINYKYTDREAALLKSEGLINLNFKTDGDDDGGGVEFTDNPQGATGDSKSASAAGGGKIVGKAQPQIAPQKTVPELPPGSDDDEEEDEDAGDGSKSATADNEEGDDEEDEDEDDDKVDEEIFGESGTAKQTKKKIIEPKINFKKEATKKPDAAIKPKKQVTHAKRDSSDDDEDEDEDVNKDKKDDTSKTKTSKPTAVPSTRVGNPPGTLAKHEENLLKRPKKAVQAPKKQAKQESDEDDSEDDEEDLLKRPKKAAQAPKKQAKQESDEDDSEDDEEDASKQSSKSVTKRVEKQLKKDANTEEEEEEDSEDEDESEDDDSPKRPSKSTTKPPKQTEKDAKKETEDEGEDEDESEEEKKTVVPNKKFFRNNKKNQDIKRNFDRSRKRRC